MCSHENVKFVQRCIINVESIVEAYIFNVASNLNNWTWNVLSVCSTNGTFPQASRCGA
jgi:hypothetical protein